jgi:hypothetical protein
MLIYYLIFKRLHVQIKNKIDNLKSVFRKYTYVCINKSKQNQNKNKFLFVL